MSDPVVACKVKDDDGLIESVDVLYESPEVVVIRIETHHKVEYLGRQDTDGVCGPFLLRRLGDERDSWEHFSSVEITSLPFDLFTATVGVRRYSIEITLIAAKCDTSGRRIYEGTSQ